jgi:hypothetical protein
MQQMLTEVCNNLKNWFWHEQNIGKITIDGGALYCNNKPVDIKQNQYYRIIGSIFSDGIWKYDGEDIPQNEEFDGAIWTLAIPAAFLAIIEEMKEWEAHNGGVDSEMMSPFQSESFGGYSYSKASGGSSSGDSSAAPTAFSVYSKRLNIWRKI